eukprot:CAMPEP_0174235054 /NCGR_PEP_ID=MMETSP0417-20130205/4620_1 /TAXON_ID=242541 /ORGANISM="Mayorella sp, Strain BSH-02190019" /LENGTH=876 /DNA_ID=CAMNT_0015313499 /DNA_START=54 /DNA_END=2680 /DNA_ORIENTATION=+
MKSRILSLVSPFVLLLVLLCTASAHADIVTSPVWEYAEAGRTHVDIAAAYDGTQVVPGDTLLLNVLLEPSVNTTAHPTCDQVCVAVTNTGNTLALVPDYALVNGIVPPPLFSWSAVRTGPLSWDVCALGVPSADGTSLALRLVATPEGDFLDSMEGLFLFDLELNTVGRYSVAGGPSRVELEPLPALELAVLKPYLLASFPETSVRTPLFEEVSLLLEVDNYDLGRSFNSTLRIELTDGLYLVNVTRAYKASPLDPLPTVLGESTNQNPLTVDTVAANTKIYLYISVIAYECLDQSLVVTVDDVAFRYLGLNGTTTTAVDTLYSFPNLVLTPAPVYTVTEAPIAYEFELLNNASGRAHAVEVKTSFSNRIAVENVSAPWIYDPDKATFLLSPPTCENCTEQPWVISTDSVLEGFYEKAINFTLRINDDFDRCVIDPPTTREQWTVFYETDCGSSVSSLSATVEVTFFVRRLEIASTFSSLLTLDEPYRIPLGWDLNYKTGERLTNLDYLNSNVTVQHTYATDGPTVPGAVPPFTLSFVDDADGFLAIVEGGESTWAMPLLYELHPQAEPYCQQSTYREQSVFCTYSNATSIFNCTREDTTCEKLWHYSPEVIYNTELAENRTFFETGDLFVDVGGVEAEHIPFQFRVDSVDMEFYWAGTEYVDELGLLVLNGTLLQLLESNVTLSYDGVNYTVPSSSVSYISDRLVVSLGFMTDELGSDLGRLNDTELSLYYSTGIDDQAIGVQGDIRTVTQYAELSLNISTLALATRNCTGEEAVLTGVVQYNIARATVIVELSLPTTLYHCLSYTANINVTNRYDKIEPRNLTITYEHISAVQRTSSNVTFEGYFEDSGYTFDAPVITDTSISYEFDPLLFGWG